MISLNEATRIPNPVTRVEKFALLANNEISVDNEAN